MTNVTMMSKKFDYSLHVGEVTLKVSKVEPNQQETALSKENRKENKNKDKINDALIGASLAGFVVSQSSLLFY